MTKLYRKATVTRTKAEHIERFGHFAFSGLFVLGHNSDGQIVNYFSDKMQDEGYSPEHYAIELVTVMIDPLTGETILAD
jgi:hypothetical protein